MYEDKLDGLARRLKQSRTDKGLSLDEAAAVLGINKSTINRCETGKQVPDAKYLFQFEEFAGKSSAWLLSGSEVDESACSLREKRYRILVEAVSALLARTLAERKLKVKWRYYGKITRILVQLSLESVLEGNLDTDINDDIWLQSELAKKLQSHIDSMLELIEREVLVRPEL